MLVDRFITLYQYKHRSKITDQKPKISEQTSDILKKFKSLLVETLTDYHQVFLRPCPAARHLATANFKRSFVSLIRLHREI